MPLPADASMAGRVQAGGRGWSRLLAQGVEARGGFEGGGAVSQALLGRRLNYQGGSSGGRHFLGLT